MHLTLRWKIVAVFMETEFGRKYFASGYRRSDESETTGIYYSYFSLRQGHKARSHGMNSAVLKDTNRPSDKKSNLQLASLASLFD